MLPLAVQVDEITLLEAPLGVGTAAVTEEVLSLAGHLLEPAALQVEAPRAAVAAEQLATHEALSAVVGPEVRAIRTALLPARAHGFPRARTPFRLEGFSEPDSNAVASPALSREHSNLRIVVVDDLFPPASAVLEHALSDGEVLVRRERLPLRPMAFLLSLACCLALH